MNAPADSTTIPDKKCASCGGPMNEQPFSVAVNCVLCNQQAAIERHERLAIERDKDREWFITHEGARRSRFNLDYYEGGGGGYRG